MKINFKISLILLFRFLWTTLINNMESKDSSEDNGGPQEASVDVPHGSDSKTEESDAALSGNVQDEDPENVPEEEKE